MIDEFTREQVLKGLQNLRAGYANDEDRTPYDTLGVIINDVKNGKYDDNLEAFYTNTVETLKGYCGNPDEDVQ